MYMCLHVYIYIYTHISLYMRTGWVLDKATNEKQQYIHICIHSPPINICIYLLLLLLLLLASSTPPSLLALYVEQHVLKPAHDIASPSPRSAAFRSAAGNAAAPPQGPPGVESGTVASSIPACVSLSFRSSSLMHVSEEVGWLPFCAPVGRQKVGPPLSLDCVLSCFAFHMPSAA